MITLKNNTIGKLLIVSAGVFFYVVLSVRLAMAATEPTFPVCNNPQGDLRVQYDSGTHGIVGDLGEHQGSDSVYRLTDDTLTQCFCAENSQGVQTNWWRVSSLTQEEIDIMRRQGWNYIPNGALWGLDEVPYLAKNSDFVCGGGTGGGDVLGLATNGKVLGLATTGTLPAIFSLGVLGLASFSAAIWLRRTA